MDKRAFTFEIKSFSEETGTFTGLASVFGNEDLVGDIVERGAFKRTIEQNPEVPILWQHDAWEPIGKGRVSETFDGLLIEGKLALGVQRGREAHELLKEDALRGLSIGYDTLDYYLEDEVRHLSEVRLWEVSLVTFAANPKAQVLNVKEKQPDPNEATLPDKFRRKLRQVTSESVLQVMDMEHAIKEGRVLSKRNLSLVDAAIEALTKLAEAARREEEGKGLSKEAPEGSAAAAAESVQDGWDMDLAQKWMGQVLQDHEDLQISYTAQEDGITCSVTHGEGEPLQLEGTKAFHEGNGTGDWWQVGTSDNTGDFFFPTSSPNVYIPAGKDGWAYPVLPAEPPYIIEFPILEGGSPIVTEEEPPAEPEEGKGEEPAPEGEVADPAGDPQEEDPFDGVTLNEEEAAALDEFGKSLASMKEEGEDGKAPPEDSSGPTSDDPLLEDMRDFASQLTQQREDE